MRIKELILQSGNFEAQKVFYKSVIGLPVLSETENRMSFEVGSSRLTFIRAEQDCYYHFAFNIFSNQEQEALAWLKARVEILQFENRSIQLFKNWNARAVYFYDQDKNIVEFIARKNLNIKSNNNFTAKSILNISEAGLPCDSVETSFDLLNKHAALEKYSGDLERFVAAGDEEGLFILVGGNKKTWFPTTLAIEPFPLECYFSNAGKNFRLNTVDNHIKLQLTTLP